MSTVKTLSTTQVSALTNVSMPTLKRYIKSYGQHFSETARQNKRGRRWTPDDVEKVILINRVSATKPGAEKVNALLDQDTEAEQQNLLTSNQVLEIAVNVLSQIEDHRRAVEKMIQTAEWKRIDYMKFEKEYSKKIKLVFFQLDRQMSLLQTVNLKMGYHQTRNPRLTWMKRALDRFEEWFEETYPSEYEQAKNPPTWADSAQQYQEPED